jgi:hypothetical protein
MGKNFSANQKTENRNKDDFYQTPYSITQQLLDNVYFSKEGSILEPSCGNGAIVKVLNENGYFDITPIDLNIGINFLEYKETHDYIIANPPFKLALQFILHSKNICNKKIAMLLPLSYLHGEERFSKLYSDKQFPLKEIHIFTRYPMLSEKIREDGKYATGMMVYAWYIWEKSYSAEPPVIKWISNQKYILNKNDKV